MNCKHEYRTRKEKCHDPAKDVTLWECTRCHRVWGALPKGGRLIQAYEHKPSPVRRTRGG